MFQASIAVLLMCAMAKGQETEEGATVATPAQAPEWIAEQGAWIHWDEPRTLADLRGHVLWLELSFTA